MRPVQLLEPARLELLEAVRYYRAEAGPDVARRFRDEFVRVLRHARQFPRGGPVVERNESLELRHFLLRDFPFMLIAADVAPALIVFAVAHQ